MQVVVYERLKWYFRLFSEKTSLICNQVQLNPKGNTTPRHRMTFCGNCVSLFIYLQTAVSNGNIYLETLKPTAHLFITLVLNRQQVCVFWRKIRTKFDYKGEKKTILHFRIFEEKIQIKPKENITGRTFGNTTIKLMCTVSCSCLDFYKVCV